MPPWVRVIHQHQENPVEIEEIVNVLYVSFMFILWTVPKDTLTKVHKATLPFLHCIMSHVTSAKHETDYFITVKMMTNLLTGTPLMPLGPGSP